MALKAKPFEISDRSTISNGAATNGAMTNGHALTAASIRPNGHVPRALGDPLVLPPGVSSEKFQAFITRVSDVVSHDNVTIITGIEELSHHSYHDPSKAHDMFNVLDEQVFVNSAVVAPRSVQEVQELMKICNELVVPVWPFSVGRNVGYGGTGARVPGSVGLDLGRNMNRIIEVNVQGAYALVEPGVNYFDLHNYLVDQNLRDQLWADVPDLGGGSVMGNALERGIGYTPYGDHWSMHCGLEIVLSDGSLIRTGMGAMPNPNADTTLPPDQQTANEFWQLFNYGFGPYNDGIFSQSSLGIVVKMGVWLMNNPGGFQSYCVTIPTNEDLHQAIEVIRDLRLKGVIQNSPTLRHVLMDAAMAGNRKKYKSSPEPLTDSEVDKIAADMKLGRWNFYGALYGPQPILDGMWTVIKAAFTKIPGAGLFLAEDMPDNQALQVRNMTQQGIPSLHELKWAEWYPNGSHLFFTPIAKMTGDDALAQYNLSRRRCDEYKFDFVGAFAIGLREMHHVVCILYDRKDPDQRRRAHRLISTLVEDARKMGWGEYRTHLALMDQVAESYSFNDNALMKFNQRLKDCLDPNGIISPGKNGVWPKSYDKEAWKRSLRESNG